MNDFIKPSLRNNPDHFILHVGTNDLVTEASAEEKAGSITDIAQLLKNEQHDVTISNIILRTDNQKLNNKRNEVNRCLSELCKEKNVYLIDHSQKIKPRHLNKSKLHLNRNEANLICNSFISEISRIFN